MVNYELKMFIRLATGQYCKKCISLGEGYEPPDSTLYHARAATFLGLTPPLILAT